MRINKYKNDIYPYDLWVADNIDIDVLVSMFTFLYNDDTEVPIEEVKDMLNDNSSFATTYKVMHNKTKDLGSLVIIYQEVDVDSIAHEAGHVTQDIAEYVDLELEPKEPNEHIMYLLGWVAGRIDKFIKNGKN